MVAVADKIIYRDEWIQGYERRAHLFRTTTTPHTMVDGKTAYFLVANSNREAVTRGPNGLIPPAADDFNTPSVTLAEQHDKPRKTRFNVFTGQSDQRAIMQAQSRNVIHRAIDDKIVAALSLASTSIGSSAVLEKGLVTTAVVSLGTSEVPLDDQIFGAMTPNAWGQLTDLEEFTSSDYVEMKPLVGMVPNPQADSVTFKKWMGVNWFVSTALPGMGTSSATCFIYHRSAIGYASPSELINVAAGYNDEDDYYYARHSVFHGATILQGAGIVKLDIDDTQYQAA